MIYVRILSHMLHSMQVNISPTVEEAFAMLQTSCQLYSIHHSILLYSTPPNDYSHTETTHELERQNSKLEKSFYCMAFVCPVELEFIRGMNRASCYKLPRGRHRDTCSTRHACIN